MPDVLTQQEQRTGPGTAVIAQASTTGALEAIARPLGRSVVALAAMTVADAVFEACGGEQARIAGGTGAGTIIPAHGAEPVLSRLLALDVGLEGRVTVHDGRGAEPAWAVWRDSATGTVMLQRASAAPAAVGALPVVAGLAAWQLRNLADVGEPSRWMEPLPATIAPRWQQRQRQEAAAAASFIADWLRLRELPAKGAVPEAWWGRAGLDAQQLPLCQTWIRWMREQEFLEPGTELLRAGPMLACLPSITATRSTDSSVDRMVEALRAHEQLIARVLRGEAPGTDLLAVPELRPMRIAAAEPALEGVWQQIVEEIGERAARSPRPLVLADVGGTVADNPALERGLEQFGVRRLAVPAGRPHSMGELADVVLAVGTLHRWADPGTAARSVRDRMHPEGLLLAVENTDLSGLGVLVAGLIEGGFVDAVGTPRTSPTHGRETWLSAIEDAGLRASAVAVGPTPAVLITAEPGTAGQAQPTQPRSGEDPRDRPGSILSGTEAEVARLWAAFVATPPRDRQDSFFELGGDSLRATHFLAALRQRFDITLAMRELFVDPRLAAVAARVDAQLAAAEVDSEELEEGVL